MSDKAAKIVSVARGLVRPMTAYACLILLIVTYARGQELDPAMTGIVGTVIGFYFGDRAHAKANEHVKEILSNGNSGSE